MALSKKKRCPIFIRTGTMKKRLPILGAPS